MKKNWVFLKEKFFGPKINEEVEFKIRTNDELKILFGETNIIGVMKGSRI